VINGLFFLALGTERSEAIEALDQKSVRSMIDGESTPPLMFVYERKYEEERQIVRRITNVGEYEEFHKETHGRARIGIALVDLNGDGRPDILACLHHFAFDTSGDCVLLVCINQPDGSWQRVLWQPTGGTDIFILSTKQLGHRNIVFQGLCRPLTPGTERESCKERTVYLFDGHEYRSFLKAEMDLDSATDTVTVSANRCSEPGLAPGRLDVR